MADHTANNHASLGRWQALQDLGERLEGLLLLPQSAADFPSALDALALELDRLMALDVDLGVFEVVRISPDKLSRYGALHSLHTACVLWLVARRKEWTDGKRLSVMKAALTMNISVTALQTTLALQAGPMLDDQRARMNDHPRDSERLLRSLGVADEDWLTAVLQHHESPDPAHGVRVTDLADALRTCDVFCAKMSPRAGRPAMLSPSAALSIFQQRSANKFGASVVSTIGVFPPGALVALGTGEQAIVTERTHDPMRPMVALLTDERGQPLDAPVGVPTGRDAGRPVAGAAKDASLAGLFTPADVLRTRSS
jgi:HD-GYP domain-containing protein (c-di-GMP phosphodiesterase class II)